MSTLDSTERFPWAEYKGALQTMEALCRDRDAKGRNHDTPMLDLYSLQDLAAELKHRLARLQGAEFAIQQAIDPDAHRGVMKAMIEDALDMANYAVFYALKTAYQYDTFKHTQPTGSATLGDEAGGQKGQPA